MGTVFPMILHWTGEEDPSKRFMLIFVRPDHAREDILKLIEGRDTRNLEMAVLFGDFATDCDRIPKRTEGLMEEEEKLCPTIAVKGIEHVNFRLYDSFIEYWGDVDGHHVEWYSFAECFDEDGNFRESDDDPIFLEQDLGYYEEDGWSTILLLWDNLTFSIAHASSPSNFFDILDQMGCPTFQHFRPLTEPFSIKVGGVSKYMDEEEWGEDDEDGFVPAGIHDNPRDLFFDSLTVDESIIGIVKSGEGWMEFPEHPQEEWYDSLSQGAP